MLKKQAEKQKEREARVRKLASPPASHVAGQMTLVGTIQKTKPYEKDSTRHKSITCKLATFVAAGNVANRIVECEEFRDLLSQLDPRYPMPSRAALD